MANPDGYNIPIDFRIGQQPPDVEDNKTKYYLSELYDFAQQIIQTFNRLCGIGFRPPSQWSMLAATPAITILEGQLNRSYILASVNITAGQYINLFNSGGVLKARLAKADNLTTQADGYCTMNITAGNVGEFILNRGDNSFLSGLTIAQRYWLSASTAGGVQTTAPVAAGQIEQSIGIALDATDLVTSIQYPIQH